MPACVLLLWCALPEKQHTLFQARVGEWGGTPIQLPLPLLFSSLYLLHLLCSSHHSGRLGSTHRKVERAAISWIQELRISFNSDPATGNYLTKQHPSWRQLIHSCVKCGLHLHYVYYNQSKRSASLRSLLRWIRQFWFMLLKPTSQSFTLKFHLIHAKNGGFTKRHMAVI